MSTQLTPTKISYIAGIIDGEGSIYISKAKRESAPNYCVNLKVAMNDNHSIKFIQNLFGGNITIGRKKKRGRLSSNDIYVLKYGMQKAKRILNKCLPFFKVKREQAVLALRMIELKEKVSHSKKVSQNWFGKRPAHLSEKFENYYRKLKALKQKNWIKNHA